MRCWSFPDEIRGEILEAVIVLREGVSPSEDLTREIQSLVKTGFANSGDELMDVSLKGRSAVVTGGSQGLGLATAARFAASGANVVLFARRADLLDQAVQEIKAQAGGEVIGVVCDVSKNDSVEAGFSQAIAALGQIDIIVNNAGSSSASSFETVTDAVWQEDLDLKLFAAIRLSRLALPGMKERRWGRIINVLNTAAKAPGANTAPTAISRAAGMALTKVLSKECAPYNVLVNAMLVGVIESEQIRRWAASAGRNLDETIAEAGKDVPLGRIGRAEEFANLACFLASEQASYITGTAINVDGGRSPVV